MSSDEQKIIPEIIPEIIKENDKNVENVDNDENNLKLLFGSSSKPQALRSLGERENSISLEKEFDANKCGESENMYDKNCNKFLLRKEILESKILEEDPESNDYLYPNLNDPNFNIKIAEKKEFNDTKYDGEIYDIKTQSDILSKAEFELAPHQAFVRNFLSFQTPYNSLLLYHGLGSGKCHAKGSPIMMSTGEIKLVEDILVGDLLMGDDSAPRQVLSLAQGRDKMYDIIPIKGEKYRVNQEHILCLKTNDKVTEIAVKDYLLLSKKKQKLLKGYKVPVSFPEKEVPHDPYMIGYWSAIKTNKKMICSSIPFIYKCNSRENRLKLLAGLIDGNRYLFKNGSLVFTENNVTLKDDIVFLARSLGFACYTHVIKNKKAWRIHINGQGLEEIPTIIPLIQKSSPQQIKDALVTGIKIEYVGEGDYYGFTLDGNCRYLMGDFSVTHNTCSAIGVSEEMRDYLKQMGISRSIIIVASPNVQDNFRLQLFDERKLKNVDGLWNIRACTGNKLLKEINPMNMKGLPKDKVVSQIKSLINHSYVFLGYVEFANYIARTALAKGEYKSEKDKARKMVLNLQNEFNNRLIIIDEVHNIRISDNESKKVADQLLYLVTSANNLRLLLLSATPMYNNYREIIWLLNLMNVNDRRAVIEVRDVFDKNGDFKTNLDGVEVGKELLIRKATGYISFIRGDNPYTFPFRIYPSEFAQDNTFRQGNIPYPKYQMNGKKIDDTDKDSILSIYLTKIGSYQSMGYKFIIDSLRKRKITITTNKGVIKEMPSFENMDGFGYTLLQIPLEALNIVYPMDNLEEVLKYITPIEKFEELALESDKESIVPAGIEIDPVEPFGNEREKDAMDKELERELEKESEKELEKEKIVEKQSKCPKGTHRNKKTGNCEPYTNKNAELKPKLPVLSEANPSIMDDIEQMILAPGPILEINRMPSSLTSITTATTATAIANAIEKNTMLLGGDGSSPILSMQDIYINANDLTGHRGLERIMDFVDSKNPPEKGSFEYKQSSIDNNWKVFSPTEIGKYSAKIKNICDSIVVKTGGKVVVSDGIILIYSQYIDGGLIPVALALEEMGFSRFGKNTKSLFKSPPTSPVDAITMEPRKNRTDPFQPARYSMITGDPRISPDNDFEVKSITNDDNINGHKIKVVLISKAGSEGLDFKFMRQVHILEPWYNMNRIEQIIGRAVRNFSHKDLPFEKRNVEIFMYGTLLEEGLEEAADLYVYRVAEYKAIQIGQVSRVLKENAVDCIINHDQINFTQDNMNMRVKQILSDGDQIDFQVGDAPYSANCDYMADCQYKCNVTDGKQELTGKIKEDTYNESFIMMNSDKILQKIKNLMKDRYFYKKKDLLNKIDIPKPYPRVQVYAALTQLIEDTNEFIMDSYGRTGYLVNIGDYYLFQPSELNNDRISIFDRSVPIDYKHNEIKFNIKADIVQPVIDTRNISKLVKDEKEGAIEQKGIKIVNELKENYELALSISRNVNKKIPRGDDNWYKHCGMTMRTLVKDFNVPPADVLEILVEHIVDEMQYEDKLDLLNYLFSNGDFEEKTFEFYVKSYLETKLIKTKSLLAIILYAGNKSDTRKIMILNENNVWTEAKSEDRLEVAKKVHDILGITPDKYNKLIGFIGYDNKNRYLVFKVKDVLAKRNTGARCEEAAKDKRIDVLNEIIGEQKYTKKNEEDITPEEKSRGVISTKGMVSSSMCSLQEFLLRYYNKIHRDGKIWFLDFELAMMYQF